MKGFTLVELIVLMALMAIGAAIAVPNLRGVMSRAEQTKYETYLRGAKASVQNFVDLLNMGLTKYPLTESDGYTVKEWDISNPKNLEVALNGSNTEQQYEYSFFGTDYKTDKKSTLPTSGDATPSNKTNFTGKKDVILVSIFRNGNGIYSIRGFWYYNRTNKTYVMTYRIYDKEVFKKGNNTLSSL